MRGNELLDYDIILDEPYHDEFSAWYDNIPIAFFLTDLIKPKIFVELGVHNGTSYFAFCQATGKLNLETKCFGIDHWHGDQHAGTLVEETFDTVNKYNESHYKDFSKIVKKSFDEALFQFKDRSVDLLHIDGEHTYQTVKNDFLKWLPKMSSNGVIIFHDTMVKENGFGVYRLWEEITEEYKNHFNFEHGYGLGILFLGENNPHAENFFNVINHTKNFIKIFERLGSNLLNSYEVEKAGSVIKEMNDELENRALKIDEYHNVAKEKSSEISKKNIEIDNRNKELKRYASTVHQKNHEIIDLQKNIIKYQQSFSWKITKPIRFIKNIVKKHLPSLMDLFTRLEKITLNKPLTKPSSKNEYFTLESQMEILIDKYESQPQEPIDIIIPIYTTKDSFKYLRPLFTSLKRNTTSPYRIVAIDDNSPDPRGIEYIKKISKDFKDFALIENTENIGFVKSVNMGINNGKNHFVILNTDTEVPRFWLERLMKPILEDGVASATPFTNAGEIFSFPSFLKNNEIFENKDINEIDNIFRKISLKKYYEVPTGMGFCMGMNRKVVDKIGNFDAETFLKGYGEENDWCMRAKKAGYKNVLVHNLFVYHKHGGSFPKDEKVNLLRENYQKLLKKHPEYQDIVHQFIKEDPYKNIRDFISLLAHLELNDSEVFFDHAFGGGSKFYTDEYIEKKIKNNVSILEVRYDFTWKKYIIKLTSRDFKSEVKIEKLSAIFTLFDHLKINQMTINSLVSFPNVPSVLKEIIKIKKKHNPDLVIKMHDYFPISPNYVLLNNNDEYTGVVNQREYLKDYKKNKRQGDYRYIGDYKNINQWRQAWGDTLKITDHIEVFSNSSKKIVTEAYPFLKESQIKVIPHKVNYIDRKPQINKDSNQINIGILGSINHHKGLVTIDKISKEISSNGKEERVFVIGDTSETLENKVLKVHGKYQREDIVDLIEKYEINVIFIPSIYPETFSYTAEEAMEMDLPLVVFDIGAPAERARKYKYGKVIDINSHPKEIIDSLVDAVKVK